MTGRDGGGGCAVIGDKAEKLTAAEFARLMRAFAPFESHPVLAVAVSGGPDSLCLCLLADRWARARGGRVAVFTVDHRLRPDSASEARKVGRWLKARGIAHRILVWRGPKPSTGVPAAAREARYRLLSEACAARGILHLLPAHHRDDQAETLLFRLARGSGTDGLAAMAAETEFSDLRLLRPLLAVPKSRLTATLEAMRQDWVEDPTNRSVQFTRARLRRALESARDGGATAARLAAIASRLGRARQAMEQAAAALMARAVEIHPAGFILIDRPAFDAAPEALRLRLLSRCLTTVSGAAYAPRSEQLARLAGDLSAGRTLKGCRIVPRRTDLLICREPAAAAPPTSLPPGRPVLWDGRFLLKPCAGFRSASLAAGALGALGWAAVNQAGAGLKGIPRLAGLTIPAIRDGKGMLAVPSMGLVCMEGDGRRPGSTGKIPRYSAVFAPSAPLAPPGFAIALAEAAHHVADMEIRIVRGGAKGHASPRGV